MEKSCGDWLGRGREVNLRTKGGDQGLESESARKEAKHRTAETGKTVRGISFPSNFPKLGRGTKRGWGRLKEKKEGGQKIEKKGGM